MAQYQGRTVGIEGQERQGALSIDIRFVYARVGADEAVPRFADEHAVIHAHDALALTQDHLDVLRVLVILLCERLRERGCLHLVEVYNAPLRFRDDLLGHNEYIAGFYRQTLPL